MNQRTIKFRAWDGKVMIYGDDGYHFDFNNESYGLVDSTGTRIRTEAIMQDTGLRDKNGKKIWDGDILEIEQVVSFSRVSDVTKNTDKNYKTVVYENGNHNVPISNYSFPIVGITIVGNIYENPELI